MRKKKKFLLLEVPPDVWKALDKETVKRKGPMGRLDIKEVAIKRSSKISKELGYDEFIQFRKLQSPYQNMKMKT